MSAYETQPEGRTDTEHATVVESAPLDTFLTIEAAELTSAWTNTAGDQAVALSADGETWIEEANSESVLAEFGADAGLQATARFRLGGTSEGAVDGLDALDTPQACTEVDVQGDLNDTPLVLSKSYDDRAVNILSDLADRGDYIWEARPAAWVDDVAADVGTVISMTRPGQRESTLDTDLVRYVYETRADRRADQVVIKGSSDEIRGEEFIASVSDGSDRSVLDRQFIVNGSESVYDPALDEQYERTVDYRMEYISGRIEVLPGGSIDDGQELQIDYRGKAAGAYPDSDVLASGPRVVVETISSLTSDVECQQAALYLYRQLADPLVEAEVTIPRIDPRQSLVEAVDIEQLPGDDPYQLREIQMGESVSIRLQNRQTASERFADLEDRISQIAEQT